MWKSTSLLFLSENVSAVCSTCEPAPELLSLPPPRVVCCPPTALARQKPRACSENVIFHVLLLFWLRPRIMPVLWTGVGRGHIGDFELYLITFDIFNRKCGM